MFGRPHANQPHGFLLGQEKLGIHMGPFKVKLQTLFKIPKLAGNTRVNDTKKFISCDMIHEWLCLIQDED